MTSNEIEKQYSELRKKYKLPEFREIDLELELSDMEPTNFLFRNIIRKIAEKLDFYLRVLEEVLQPDASNLYAMHETKFFEDDEKKKMYETYAQLMGLSRQSVELSLGHDGKSEAHFISNFFDEWKPLKIELAVYAKKMRESWKTIADIKEDIGYLG